MNFVRAFELYERRWGIEVIFKECRGYLGLGKCQSRSYNAQIADTTLCFMMYQMLSLAKRFSEYETMGALFRSERARVDIDIGVEFLNGNAVTARLKQAADAGRDDALSERTNHTACYENVFGMHILLCYLFS